MNKTNMDWVIEAQSYTLNILHKNRVKYIHKRKRREEKRKREERIMDDKIKNIQIEISDFVSLCAKVKAIPGGLKKTQKAKINLFLEKERTRLYTLVKGCNLPITMKNSLIKKLSYAPL